MRAAAIHHIDVVASRIDGAGWAETRPDFAAGKDAEQRIEHLGCKMDAGHFLRGAKRIHRASLPCSSHQLQSHGNKACPLPQCRWLSCFPDDRTQGTSRSWETHILSHLGTAQRRHSSGEPQLIAESTCSQLSLIRSLSTSSVQATRKTEVCGWKPLGTAGRDTSYCHLGPGAQQSCTFEWPHLAPAGLVMEEEEEEGNFAAGALQLPSHLLRWLNASCLETKGSLPSPDTGGDWSPQARAHVCQGKVPHAPDVTQKRAARPWTCVTTGCCRREVFQLGGRAACPPQFPSSFTFCLFQLLFPTNILHSPLHRQLRCGRPALHLLPWGLCCPSMGSLCPTSLSGMLQPHLGSFEQLWWVPAPWQVITHPSRSPSIVCSNDTRGIAPPRGRKVPDQE